MTVNKQFSDFRPSGTQAVRPDVYELQNRAPDPDSVVWVGMSQLAPWTGHVLVDLGCGSGFWLGRYADEAEEVVGVEPAAELVAMARARDAHARAGSPAPIPLPDSSGDVVHARFAHF